jgi:hypothetical protein
MQTSVLYYGGSLDILRRYVPDAAVDLVYLDPPSTPIATKWRARVLRRRRTKGTLPHV